MERTEYEVLYGGAAGGGKSDSLLVEALRQVDIPHYRGIIFRKTYPQLSELIDRSQTLYSLAFPKAKYNDSNPYQGDCFAPYYKGMVQDIPDESFSMLLGHEIPNAMWDRSAPIGFRSMEMKCIL